MHKLLLAALVTMACGMGSPMANGDIPNWAMGVEININLNDAKSAGELVVSDPAVWKLAKVENGQGFLQLEYDRKKYKSTYTPKYRSPVHIALLKQYPLTDFVMDVELQSTTEPYDHQSLCLFFGFQSPEKYYYVHLGRKADMNANNVFIVNEAARKNIATETSKGVEWKGWHTARLIRQASSGTIEVYFDDMSKPIMRARDKTFDEGCVGVGSFDDTGIFRRISLHTKNLTIDARKQPAFFKPLGK